MKSPALEMLSLGCLWNMWVEMANKTVENPTWKLGS